MKIEDITKGGLAFALASLLGSLTDLQAGQLDRELGEVSIQSEGTLTVLTLRREGEKESKPRSAQVAKREADGSLRKINPWAVPMGSHLVLPNLSPGTYVITEVEFDAPMGATTRISIRHEKGMLWAFSVKAGHLNLGPVWTLVRQGDGTGTIESSTAPDERSILSRLQSELGDYNPWLVFAGPFQGKME